MLTEDTHGFHLLRDAVKKAAGQSPILDLGTPRRFHKEIGAFRDLFKSTRYLAFGYHATGAGEVDAVADAQILPLKSNCLGAVLCIEVLEHLPDPVAAVNEIHRCLSRSGTVVATIPFLRGWHGRVSGPEVAKHDHYRDYWRFTHEGLMHLFRHYSSVEVQALSGRWGDRIERIESNTIRRMASRIFKRSLAAELLDPTQARRFLVWAQK